MNIKTRISIATHGEIPWEPNQRPDEFTSSLIKTGIELYREWECRCDCHGGNAALELNVEELIISLFVLARKQYWRAPHDGLGLDVVQRRQADLSEVEWMRLWPTMTPIERFATMPDSLNPILNGEPCDR